MILHRIGKLVQWNQRVQAIYYHMAMTNHPAAKHTPGRLKRIRMQVKAKYPKEWAIASDVIRELESKKKIIQ